MSDLIYASDFKKDSFKILELSNDELVKEFESGKSVTIKGLPEDEAVLCTDTTTYTVRQINTSNSLLLCTANDHLWQVFDDLSCTVELLPCRPRTARLIQLLGSTSYTGPENEYSLATARFYTFSQLLSIVQASANELVRALDNMHSFTLDGYQRVINHAYLHQMLDALATNATIYGHDLHRFTLQQAFTCLDQDFPSVPEPVRMAFLHAFVKDVHHSELCLDDKKVCRFLGLIVLETERGREWKMEDFMETWTNLVQLILDIQPVLTTLKGLYYTTERQVLQVPQLYITYLPSDELPTDPAERFTRLFQEKPQWSPEDIFPYIDDLAQDSKQRDSLLLKFTRMQKIGNRIIYGSRIK